MIRRPLSTRTFAKVDLPDDCWLWNGSLDGKGYGQIQRGHRGEGIALAHRVLYELLVGPIPSDLELDHLCRNKRCVNPKHVEPVTHRENMVRAARARRDGPPRPPSRHTVCPKGHPLSGDNLYVEPNGGYICRICRREANRRREQRRREAKVAAA